ncbi:Phosphomannomutase 1 [Plenodomus lindquistii]|nr:Phosphomannomutase 1 [Plenodomus lindquistii]
MQRSRIRKIAHVCRDVAAIRKILLHPGTVVTTGASSSGSSQYQCRLGAQHKARNCGEGSLIPAARGPLHSNSTSIWQETLCHCSLAVPYRNFQGISSRASQSLCAKTRLHDSISLQNRAVQVNMAVTAAVYPPLEERPFKDTVLLFDVDDTLTKPRQLVKPEMLQLLSQLRHKCAIGFVGGSNLVKQQEQLATPDVNVTSLFDFAFAENGLTAYRLGQELESQSFIGWIGEERYKALVKFILHYIADLDIPIKRGTFIEFRNGMINVSPIGRNASTEERNEYQAYDIANNIRPTMVAALKKEFPDYGLTYSIGGQISFDVFPTGWDKTYCLKHIEGEEKRTGVVYKNIHFFGDKAYEGGNDWEIYSDSRTIGHKVKNPDDTYAQLQELLKTLQ